MKNTAFWLGLLLGMLLSLLGAGAFFYFYIYSEIESLKTETRTEFKSFKSFWESELKEEVLDVKSAAWKLAEEKWKAYKAEQLAKDSLAAEN
ncbi:hypothetical protein [Saprospira grandis]|uniref:Uncharacterized protein n=1 Tax=Saprospira grandis (strain Lewin) TaxID=984262 RepID=H6L540_SAPGL|nr:hypothetical protein [Saprospira grandis]AFC22912.1 hypothetical protein SGRA_0171 [Saprospira grandis str. Lewin]